MPKAQVLQRQARGLYSRPNRLSAVPEGAFLEADNVFVNREGVLSKARGFRRHMALTTGAESLFQVRESGRDHIVAHDGDTLRYDSDFAGTPAAWSGQFYRPGTDHRIRAIQARENTYFTTSAGVKKIDSIANGPADTGMPQGLDVELEATGVGTGWFSPDSQVGYRILWGREDANEFEVKGAPSYRETIANANNDVTLSESGGVVTVTHTAHGYSDGDTIVVADASETAYEDGEHSIIVTDANTYTYTIFGTPTAAGTAKVGKKFNVDLTFTVPADIQENDFYEIYRTELSANAGTDPGDEFLLVARKDITTAQVAAGLIEFSDDVDDAFLGLRLYTNATQETETQENGRPPFALDIADFKGHVFFAGTRQPHQLEMEWRSLDNWSNGVTVTVTTTQNYVFTAAAAEDISQNEFQLYTTELTASQNVRKTAKSLVRVINRSTQGDVVAFYVSGVNDPPGKIVIRAVSVSVPSFTVVASDSGAGGDIEPSIATARDSYNDNFAHRLYRSKFEQHESVPRTNNRDIGSGRSPIRRILALRDSLIVLKEDGVWRVVEVGSGFDYVQLDPSLKILAPETAVVLNNAVFCLSNQGVVRVDENGTAIVSIPIEEDLKRIFSFTNFGSVSHAVAVERERQFWLFTQRVSNDAYPTVAWVYDYLTHAWTRRIKPCRTAVVTKGDEELFLGHADDAWVLKERKSYSSAADDFRDESVDCTVTGATTTLDADGNTVSVLTVTYSYSGWELAAGGLFEYNSRNAKITAVTSLGSNSYQITLDDQITITAGATQVGLADMFLLGLQGASSGTAAATISIPIESRVRWAPEDMGNPSVGKQFSQCQLYFEEDTAFTHRIGFRTNVNPTEVFVDEIIVQDISGWGEIAWGTSLWGSPDNRPATSARTVIPRGHQRSQAIEVVYEHNVAREGFAILNMSLTGRQYGERTTRQGRAS